MSGEKSNVRFHGQRSSIMWSQKRNLLVEDVDGVCVTVDCQETEGGQEPR